MRWPFHVGSRADAVPVAPPRRRDWASLPPIQRTIAEPALTAPTPEFIDSLAGAHEADLSLQPLGHHVSLDAPHGLVVARSVETYAPSTQMVGRPRTRHVPELYAEIDGRAEAESIASEATETTAEQPQVLPLRSVKVIEPVANTPRPLTRLTEAEMALSARVDARPLASKDTEPPRSEAPGVEAPGASASTAPVQRLTLGQSRRLGLGAPLKNSTPSEVRRTWPPSPPLDLPAAPRHMADEVTTIESPSPERTETESYGQRPETSVAIGSSEQVGLPLALPMAKHVGRDQVVASSSDSPDVDRTSDSEPHAPSSAGGTIPIVPTLQRVIAHSLPPLFAPPSVVGSLMVPLAADRMPLRPAARFGADQASDVAPRPAAPVPAADRAPIGETSATEWHFAPRSAGPHALAAVTTVTSPRRTDLPPLPLAQRETTSPVSTVAIGGHEPQGQATTESVVQASSVFVQREEAVAPASSPAADGGTAATAAPGGGAPAEAAPAHQSERELYELASKLYEPLSARIRRELLVDRERAGMVTDLR